MKTRYHLFVFSTFMCLLWHTGIVSAQNSLQNRIDQLLDDPFYQSATVGISVYDLTAGQALYQFNEKRLCRPASNMKLLTSAAALQYLAPEETFKTGLFYTGTIDGSGILRGDIHVTGGFDPEMTSSDLDSMAFLIKKAGVSAIEGNLYTDVSMADTVFWGKAWSWDDDMEAFQPYLTPLPVNKGVVSVRVIPGVPDRAPIIKTEPGSSFIRIVNEANTVWKSTGPAKETLHFSRECDESVNTIRISGTIDASSPSYETMISLKSPNRYFQMLLLEKLMQQFPESRMGCGGISALPEKAKNIGYIHRSLTDVINQLNKKSDNLNAEMLVYTLGHQAGNVPSSTEKGLEIIRQMISLLGLDATKYGIVDGSGLSNQNYLSPELMVALLKYMYASPHFMVFKESLPIAGEDGTLVYRMRNTKARKKIFAKTGSITGVCTLSGYASASNGHLLAFSVMIQNFVEKTSFVATRYADKICVALVE